MPDAIETYEDGSAAFAAARQPAWHRLGTVFTDQDSMTAEQAITAARLGGWNVRKVPVTTTEGELTVEIPDTYAVWRTNPVTQRPEVLVNGTVGKIWDPFQNEEATELLDTLAFESGAGFETAGAINSGRDVFVTMRLPQGFMVGGQDAHDLYLCCFNNHTGKRSLIVSVGDVRVVCKNTQDLHLATAKSTYYIRHTGGMRDQVAQVREALAMTLEYTGEVQAELDRMIDTAYTDAEFEGLITQLCGERDTDATARAQKAWEEETGSLRYLFREAPTQAAIRNTRYGAYQSVVEYLDWQIPVRGKGNKNEIRALRTLTNPDYSALKQDAFELLRVPVG